MAVRIRLTRRGRKKLAIYNVVVADARAPRDGRYIENLGIYNPNTTPATLEINDEKAFEWVMKGALPTDTVRRLLSHHGIMLRKHLQVGVLKGAITQEEADKKYEAWKKEKDAKIQGHVDSLTKKKADEAKKRADDEKKKNEARAAQIKAKNTPPAEEQAEEAVAAEAPAEVVEEAPAQEVTEATEEPKAEAEAAQEEPKAEEPVAEEKAEEPKAEEKAEEPKAEAKEEVAEEKAAEAEAPKAEEAKEEAPKAEAKEEASEEEKK